jgi:hypothetical protein
MRDDCPGYRFAHPGYEDGVHSQALRHSSP